MLLATVFAVLVGGHLRGIQSLSVYGVELDNRKIRYDQRGGSDGVDRVDVG